MTRNLSLAFLLLLSSGRQVVAQDFDLHAGMRGIRSISVRYVLAGQGAAALVQTGALDTMAMRARIELAFRRSSIPVLESGTIEGSNAYYSVGVLCNDAGTVKVCTVEPMVLRQASVSTDSAMIRGLVWGGLGTLLLDRDWQSMTDALQRTIDQDLTIFLNEMHKARQ